MDRRQINVDFPLQCGVRETFPVFLGSSLVSDLVTGALPSTLPCV